MNRLRLHYIFIGLLALGCNSSTSIAPETVNAKKAPEVSKKISVTPDDAASVSTIEALADKFRRDGNENLIEVDFRGATIDDSNLSALKMLPKIRSVLLSGTDVTDEGMKVLGTISTLENLDLRDCAISDDGLASLSSLGKIKAIKLSGKSGGCTVSDDGMQHIANFKNLKVLGVDSLWDISEDGIAKLTDLKNLQELYMADTPAGDEAIKLLSQFPNLRKLRFAQNQITAEGIAALPNLKKLEELDLSECSLILDDAMGPLGKMSNLKKLNLWRVNISDIGIAPIANLTTLESLNLDNTRLSDEGLAHLSGLTNLKFLHLGSTQVTDENLSQLAGLEKLKELIVTRTGVTEAGAKALQSKLPSTKIQLKFGADE